MEKSKEINGNKEITLRMFNICNVIWAEEIKIKVFGNNGYHYV